GQVAGLVQQLKGSKNRPDAAQMQAQISALEKELRSNPNDFQKALDLAMKYWSAQQPDRAFATLDGIVNNPRVDANAVFTVANIYAQMNNVQKLEPTLEKLVKLAPNEPEAWYNLAATKATLGKSSEAIKALRQSVELSTKRMAQSTNAHDLRAEAEKDPRLSSLRDLPEFKALVAH
ncbi:MAG: TPR end-of-group domain-containing protein, partial [Verrucomicrobiota bacterium]